MYTSIYNDFYILIFLYLLPHYFHILEVVSTNSENQFLYVSHKDSITPCSEFSLRHCLW